MTTVQVQDRKIHLRTEYSNLELCHFVRAGKWNKLQRRWEYPLTPNTAYDIIDQFGYEKLQGDRDILSEYAGRIVLAAALRDDPYPYQGKEPWRHQRIAYNFATTITGIRSNQPGGGVMLAMDMRTGKSRIPVEIARNHQDRIRRILIACPIKVVENWCEEFAKYWPDARILPLNNGSVAKKAGYTYNFWSSNPGFVITNYEAVWREPYAELLRTADIDLVVPDEIHRIKDPGGRASKFFGDLGKKVKWKIGLTGTPMPHSPLDAYAQYRHLDPGVFGTSNSLFKNTYAVKGGFEMKQVVGYQNIEDLNARFYRIAYRVKLRDVLPDLPEHDSVYRYFDLAPEEREIYRQMEEEFCVLLEDGAVTADNALVKLLRLQQITSGHLDGRWVGNSKLAELGEVLDDIDPREPIVIFCRFTPDIQAVKKLCIKTGRTVSELSGHADEQASWKRGETDVIVCQIQSGALGVDFTRACYTIYYSLGFSLGDYDQSQKRIEGSNQTRAGAYIHLVANKSVDKKVIRSLRNHKNIVEDVLKQFVDNELET